MLFDRLVITFIFALVLLPGEVRAEQPIFDEMPRWKNGWGFQVLQEYRRENEPEIRSHPNYYPLILGSCEGAEIGYRPLTLYRLAFGVPLWHPSTSLTTVRTVIELF